MADPTSRGSRDGRDRSGDTEIIDTYDPNNPGEGAFKEQRGLDSNGGVEALDNRRKEVISERMKDLDAKYGSKP